MHVYINIIMHENETLTIIFFFNIYLIKNNWPRVKITRGHRRPRGHIPRGHIAACNRHT
jgi:hypothetical protein